MANAWVAENEAWDLCLCRNLSDLETIEWTSLSHILSLILCCVPYLILSLGRWNLLRPSMLNLY